jgi:hypothetical protein
MFQINPKIEEIRQNALEAFKKIAEANTSKAYPLPTVKEDTIQKQLDIMAAAIEELAAEVYGGKTND